MRVLESTSPGFPTPATWDALVAQDPNGHLLQTWAWGELKGAFGWRPVRFCLDENGRLLAGAQVLFRPVGPLSIAYVPKGPFFAGGDRRPWDALWQAIHRRARRMGAILCKVEPEWRDEQAELHRLLTASGFAPSRETIQPRRTIMVDLTGSEEDILGRMKPKWRYNVRLSARKGVTVRVGTQQDLPTFHALMRITGERDGFGVHSEDYFRQAWTLFETQGRARLFLASYEGDLLAALMAFAYNGQSWYMYGASSNERRELMPNHQLQWCAMQWAKEQGCHQYDLWGITDLDGDPESQALSGVERFKLGFGGQVVRYVGAYDYIYNRPLYRLLRLAWRRRRLAG
jgi:lipid II:glycine glycyltransferase (peptidoglycan interpeptide bridge formation enzyme)